MIQANLLEVLKVLEKDNKMYEIFKDCPYQILKTVRLKKYSAGEFHLDQGEIHDTFYIIVDGEVDILVESEQGKKYYLTTYKKGRFVGELELFERKPYMSRVEGNGSVTTLELDRDQYLKWLEKDHNFSRYVLKTLCSGTYISMRKMGENTLYTLKQRVCQFLIENSNEQGKLMKSLSGELLSERMGVTPRSVNRVLKELKDKGILEVNKSKVIIKDFEQLVNEKNEK